MTEFTEGESWDEMAARVQTEVVNATYAANLMTAMTAYRTAGFTDEQAWQLTLSEHRSRLDYMGQLAMLHMENQDPGPPEG